MIKNPDHTTQRSVSSTRHLIASSEDGEVEAIHMIDVEIEEGR